MAMTTGVNTVRVIINSIPTDLSCRIRHGNCVIRVKQTGGDLVCGEIIPTGGSLDGESLTYNFLPRDPEDYIFLEVAKIIAFNLKINKPTFLYLCLRDYDAHTLMDILDALECVSGVFD